MSLAVFTAVMMLAAPPQGCVRPDLSAAAVEAHARSVVVADDRHDDRSALAVRIPEELRFGEGATFVEIPVEFRNGVITVDVAGAPGDWARPDDRGFIGVVFRVTPNAGQFEGLYVRPTNARADDQLRRNRSTQYFAYPGWSFNVLREQAPGRYESYVDLQPGAWTRLRIVVSERRAELYVGEAEHPALLVTDLKLDPTAGAVGLWVGGGTDGHFSNLSICAAPTDG